MKNIELLFLELQNFKGARNLSVSFNKITNIFGENATYKTTIFDAFKWLLTDKDSTDRKDFEIKTLDENNNVLQGLEHSVTGIISIDGIKKTLQKIYKEKWTKKRGEADEVLTGHTTLYYINDVPYSESDYKKAISEFADEILFKLLTDPLYFPQTLAWQKRREILLAICGDIPPDAVIASEDSLYPLVELFQTENDIDKIRKMLSARKKKLNDDIKNIPPRIDECNNSIKDLDFESLSAELEIAEHELEETDKQILSHIKTDPVRMEKENQLKTIYRETDNLKLKIDSQFNRELVSLRAQLEGKECLLKNSNAFISAKQNQIRQQESKIVDLDKEINTCHQELKREYESEFVLDEHQFVCPTCNRLLDSTDIDKKKTEMQENFNLNKAKLIKQLSNSGESFKTQKTAIEKEIQILREKIISEKMAIGVLQQEIDTMQDQIAIAKPQYGTLYEESVNKATVLEAELFTTNDIKESEKIAEELTAKKKILQSQTDSLKSQLRQRVTNATQRARIKELSDQERELAERIALLEGQEFLSEKFIKTKVALLEENINSKFQYVNFKLFRTQINGGIEEICEVLINGVPFVDANHAAKINAGIDIINTLSEHYQISAPIFIDNREAVNNLIPTNAQLINLIVSKDKILKVA